MEGVTSTKLTGHNGSVYALQATGNTQFYSGAGDGWIAEWNLEAGTDGKLVAEAADQVFALHKLDGSSLMVAGTMSGQLYFIDTDFSDQVKNFTYHQQGIFDFARVQDQLLVAGGDGKLSIWDWQKPSLKESVHLSQQRLRALALSPDQQMLAVGSSDGNIYVLHVGSWKILESIEAAHANSVFTVAFSKDGDYLLSGGRDAHLKSWSVFEGFALVQDLAAHWYTINSIAIHPERHVFATASRDKTIRIWEMASFQLLKTLDAQKSKGHINSVNDLCWSKDGQLLISASDDRSIIVWHLNTLLARVK